VWTEGKLFTRVLDGLLSFLRPERDAEVLEHGLVLLWELVQHQWSLMEGQEAVLLDCLFTLRSSRNATVSRLLAERIQRGLLNRYWNLPIRSFRSLPRFAIRSTCSVCFALRSIDISPYMQSLRQSVLMVMAPRFRHCTE
jgi:hypothetical protein